jgi:signal transduction histidine kinase
LERLVNDLLDYARIEAGAFQLRLEPVDFSWLVRQVLESLRPQLEGAGLALELVLPEEPIEITADLGRIERVIANLMSNAIKFTPPGGRIAVTVAGEQGQVRCEVRDTGVGIAASDMDRLFKPFSQLENVQGAKGGTGLGLSISKTIVEAHGGQMGVESDPGRGSCFWFTLP